MSERTGYWVYYDGTAVPPDAEVIMCECDSKANRTECNADELAKYNCGRSYECCCATFLCETCGKRTTVKLPAPNIYEMLAQIMP